MLNKKFPLTVLLVGIVGVLSNFLFEPILKGLNICSSASSAEICFNLFYRGYIESVALFSAALIVISLFLFFVDRRLYRPWLIFTLISIILYSILVFIAPVTSGFLQPQRDMVSVGLSVLYIVLSLILIAYKSWRFKKTRAVS